MPRFLSALALTVLLALGTPSTTSANGAYVLLDCGPITNVCFGDGDSGTGTTRLLWSFDTSGTDAIFPWDCTDQTMCRFWCPREPGPIVARLYVYDGNFNLRAVSEPVYGMCTDQDLISPF